MIQKSNEPAVVKNIKDFNDYKDSILSGKLITSRKMKLQAKRIERMLHDDRYIFNEDKASKAIEFIESYCTHFEGAEFAGRRIFLEPWQKFHLMTAYGFYYKDRPDVRVVVEVLVIVARKNGKTTEMAGTSLYGLAGDGEQAPQVHAVAVNKKQAKILFGKSQKMLQYSKVLRNLITKRRDELECKFNNGIMEPLARDSNNLDGLSSYLALFDELHAYKDSSVIEVIESSHGSRTNYLRFFITTAGYVRDGAYDTMYSYYERLLDGHFEDDTKHAFIYELDDVEEVNNPDMWIKANPNLGVSLNLDYLKAAVKTAQDDPSKMGNLLTKHFNIPQSGQGSFFTADECRVPGHEEKEIIGSRGFIGIDMSMSIDFTVVTYKTFVNDKHKVLQWYIKPEEVIDEHSRRDAINYRQYDVVPILDDTIQQQWVYDFIFEKIYELDLTVLKVGADPWRCDHIMSEFNRNFGKNFAITASNARTRQMTPVYYYVKSLLRNKEIESNNKLLPIHLGGVVPDYKKDDSINLVKRRSFTRIDGTVSMMYSFKAEQNYRFENGLSVIDNIITDEWGGD